MNGTYAAKMGKLAFSDVVLCFGLAPRRMGDDHLAVRLRCCQDGSAKESPVKVGAVKMGLSTRVL